MRTRWNRRDVLSVMMGRLRGGRGPSRVPTPREWFCSACNMGGWAARTVCYRCVTPRGTQPNLNPPRKRPQREAFGTGRSLRESLPRHDCSPGLVHDPRTTRRFSEEIRDQVHRSLTPAAPKKPTSRERQLSDLRNQLDQLEVRITKQRAHMSRLKEQWDASQERCLQLETQKSELDDMFRLFAAKPFSPTPSPVESARADDSADEAMSVSAVSEGDEEEDPFQVLPTQLAGNDSEHLGFRENEDASKRLKIKPKPKAAPSMMRLGECVDQGMYTHDDFESLMSMCKKNWRSALAR